MKQILNMFLLLILVLIFITKDSLATQPVGIDWTLQKQFQVTGRPLDIAISSDGNLLFVLLPGKVAFYSNFTDVPLKEISIEEDFDRMAYSDSNSALILTNAATHTVKILEIDLIQKIIIEGSPFQGPENATVTIALFDDYQ